MRRPLLYPGSTIIEVLIATAVVAMVLTTVVAGLSLSVKNTAQNRYKLLAGKLSQEGLETFRRLRDRMGWDAFYDTMAAQGSGRYCLNTVPANQSALGSLTAGECESGFALAGTTYTREAVVEIGGSPEEVSVTMEVSWQDADITRISSITQQFRDIR